MKTSKISVLVPILLAASCLCAARIQAQATPTSASGPITKGKVFNFEKITDGVYYATATGAMITGSNDVVIVNDNDVLLVDAGITPAVARALVQDVKLLTAKPVRWLTRTFTMTTPTATPSSGRRCKSSGTSMSAKPS